jgi:hypothetical protein
MKMVMGSVNGVTLNALHRESVKGCSDVWAAVAFATGRLPLFDPALCSVPVEFFGRLNGVHPDLLDEILRQRDRITCRLVPDSRNFHAKIIWWRGSGAYIGSANLTDAGWSRNLECGVFYEHGELTGGIGTELARFFDELRTGRLVALTEQRAAELRELFVEHQSMGQGKRAQLAALESRASAIEVGAMRVPPSSEDVPRAEAILTEIRGGENCREWLPYLAWAYHVVYRFGRAPRPTQRELGRMAGRENAQGEVGHCLEIMRTLLADNPEILVEWLRAAKRCRETLPYRRLKLPTTVPPKPVPYHEMLTEVVRCAAPEKRMRIYNRLARRERRGNRGGRPSLYL